MKLNLTSPFSRILLWQKFFALGVITLVLVAIPFTFYYLETEKAVNIAIQETHGIPPSIALLELVRVTQKHRGLSSLVLSGNTESIQRREATILEVDKATSNLATYIKAIPDEKINQAWNSDFRFWQKLQTQVAKKDLNAEQSIHEHSALIESYLSLLDKILDYYGLTLDPDADTYFMIQSILYANPALSESLGKLRAIGSGILARKQINPNEIQRLSSLLDLSATQRKVALSWLQKTFDIRPDIKTSLEPLSLIADRAYERATKLTRDEILDTSALSYPANDYFIAYTEAIDAYATRNEAGMKILDELLNKKAQNLRNIELYISLGMLALFLFGTQVTYLIIRSITKPVANLVDVMGKLSAGDNDVRVNPQSFDELGMLGRQFDVMMDQREILRAGIQKENDTLNTSIINLLQAVAKLAQKDLTTKVPVSEDVTGLIADALNLLADETAKVLHQVSELAGVVSDVSKQIKIQSDNVINVAMIEKQEVIQSNLELNETSEAMRSVARLAVSCNEAAEKAIKNTERAQETVLGTVQGITTIRDTIRETEKRIKRLGERSQEIGGVVNLINNIAERTHILALNASMHAASAGEAGRGFAVVANEVQRLAENSREATSKIAALVNNIQVETADTVITMNEAIGQVVRGTELAQQAGNEMRETRDTTADLVLLVQRIATNSTAQAESTNRLQERARQIQKNTEHTFEQLQEQGIQTDQLVGLSDALVESVGVFKLPEDMNS
jgi:methyl-accepting chemotaxis protein